MNQDISIIHFGGLSSEDKIELFQKNQNLLIEYNPKSPFIVRDIKNAKSKIVQHYIHMIKNYKGRVAIHSEFLLFFRILQINDFDDILEFRSEESASDEGICVFVDYIAGKANVDNLKSLEPFFKDKKVTTISYVKHENIQNIPLEKYKKALLKRL